MNDGAWRKWTLNNRKGMLSCTANVARFTIDCVGLDFVKCIALKPWKKKLLHTMYLLDNELFECQWITDKTSIEIITVMKVTLSSELTMWFWIKKKFIMKKGKSKAKVIVCSTIPRDLWSWYWTNRIPLSSEHQVPLKYVWLSLE